MITLYPDDNTLPGGESEVGLHEGKFTNGDPAVGISPSRIWAPHLNLLTDLLQTVITTGTGAADNVDTDQLLSAIRQIIHPIGSIQLWSFPEADLPFGWYLCDGMTVTFESPQGQALFRLSESYRSRWGITVDTTAPDARAHTVTKPDLRSCFLRGVDGNGRTVGNFQDWAVENIVGNWGYSGSLLGEVSSGAIYLIESTMAPDCRNGGENAQKWGFDASRVVKTADETRPMNRGMTPAIFLNV